MSFYENISVATLKIVNVDAERKLVVFRTDAESIHSATLFAYNHETLELTFFDPNESDDFDPTETTCLDTDANEHFTVGCSRELAVAIAYAIYNFYKYCDRIESFCELEALRDRELKLLSFAY